MGASSKIRALHLYRFILMGYLCVLVVTYLLWLFLFWAVGVPWLGFLIDSLVEMVAFVVIAFVMRLRSKKTNKFYIQYDDENPEVHNLRLGCLRAVARRRHTAVSARALSVGTR